jgi:hypothetical protein
MLSSRVQPSLTGTVQLVVFNPGLASWAKFNRPFGTPVEFSRIL